MALYSLRILAIFLLLSIVCACRRSPSQTEIDKRAEELPSEASARGLVVLKATYGVDETQHDVKDLVKSKVQNERLNFKAVSGELGGDPIVGKVKTFYIKYSSNGKVVEKSFIEGADVSLP
jgi:hypothetical protein